VQFHEAAADFKENQSAFMETLAPLDEARKVAALRATIDTLTIVRSLDAEQAGSEKRAGLYSEELTIRMEDVRQTLNNTGQYGNQYAVERAFERANAMLREMGVDTRPEPGF